MALIDLTAAKEAQHENGKRNTSARGDQRPASKRDAAHHLSGVQSSANEEKRSLPERDVQAGRGGLELLALRGERR